MEKHLHRLARPCFAAVQLLCVLAMLASSGITTADQHDELWSITPEPAWGSQANGDPAVRKVKGGKYYHLSERQHRYGASHQDYASYLRYMYTITNASGLDDGGYLMIDFDPAYETVQLHKVLVHRDDQTIDMLDRDKIQLLQREKDLDSNLYNGLQSLHLLLDDQRVNDRIEVSYTRHGRNPVFASRVFGWNYMQSSVPVGNYYFSINYPQSKRVKTRVFAGSAEPVITHATGFTRQTWDLHNVPGQTYQSNAPYVHIAQTLVQYSEFDSWTDVSTWLQPVYKPAAENNALVVEKAEEIKSEWKTQPQRIAAAIQFVQDKIRYTGINSGIGGWVPDQTHDILLRRFGDCKDKSVLLTALLHELGVEAHPVLVDTRDGAMISEYLPTPTTFDHMIVHIPDYQGKSYWIDPTRSLQGIGLDILAQGYYQHALIPAQPERGLVSYQRPVPAIPNKSVLEEYDLKENFEDQPSTLTITSTFRDHSAEYMRRTIEQSSTTGLEEEYLQYYQNRYDDISISKSMSINDDRNRNVLVIVESYHIQNAWSVNDDDSTETEKKFEIYAYGDAVTERFSMPTDKRRHQPLYQPHPVYVEHKLRLTDAGGWDFKNQSYTVENDYFTYNNKRQVKGDSIELDYTVKTHQSIVGVKDSKQYLRDLKKLLNKSYFYASYKEPIPTGFDKQLMSIGRWFSENADILGERESASTTDH